MSLRIPFIMLVSYLLTSFNVTATEQADHKLATATFSGGCFWCMEQPFDLLPGVIKTMPGYTGGNTKNPTYKELSPFGQCVINKHVDGAIDEVATPRTNETPNEKKVREEVSAVVKQSRDQLRDIVLDTIGVDSLLRSSDLVGACTNKLPPNTPDLKKAARNQKT